MIALSFSRARQITDSHCGPAVVQMLLESQGVHVAQEDVARAGGAEATIEVHGMRADQLERAVRELAPNLRFWCRENAELALLADLVLVEKLPVGVEWQGVFGDEQTTDPDAGHYSIVSHVDLAKRELVIVDPYKDFVDRDRIFTFEDFVPRWWDVNLVEGKLVEDRHMLFVVAPADRTDQFDQRYR